MCTGKYIECSKVEESKPRRRMTKREQKVMKLHNRLPELSEAQRRWMLSLFNDIGYYWKRGEVWCQHCGHIEKIDMPQLAVDLECDGYVCPACGHRLLLKHYREVRGNIKAGLNTGFLTTVVTTIGGQQVFRTFMSERCNVKGEPTRYEQHAIFENWIDEQGREVILSRQYTRSIWSMTWHYHSEWSVKKHNGGGTGYYVTNDLFDVYGNWFYPVWRMAPVVKRNGWCRSLISGLTPTITVMNLLRYPEFEMMAKTRQVSMFRYACIQGQKDMKKYLPSIRICNRNEYIIEDAGMWCDYVDLLQYFGKDIHNAYYVCPENLRVAHDRLMRKKMAIEERERTREQVAEAVKHEKEYEQMKGRFFGVCFGNERIVVTVICSVRDMALEGAAMHHCVYANGYYKKEGSLILSARDIDGKRLETVEVSLRTWQVVQSRGVCNQPTEFHDEIVRLVEKNMYQLKQVA